MQLNICSNKAIKNSKKAEKIKDGNWKKMKLGIDSHMDKNMSKEWYLTLHGGILLHVHSYDKNTRMAAKTQTIIIHFWYM